MYIGGDDKHLDTKIEDRFNAEADKPLADSKKYLKLDVAGVPPSADELVCPPIKYVFKK